MNDDTARDPDGPPSTAFGRLVAYHLDLVAWAVAIAVFVLANTQTHAGEGCFSDVAWYVPAQWLSALAFVAAGLLGALFRRGALVKLGCVAAALVALAYTGTVLAYGAPC